MGSQRSQLIQLLGSIAMAGAAVWLLTDFVRVVSIGFRPEPRPAGDPLVTALSLLYVLSWMCSVLGLLQLGATGTGVSGKTVLVVQLLLLSLAGIWALLILPQNPDRESLLFQATGAAWPLSHLFMAVVGIAAIRANVLSGWRRFAPLLPAFAVLVAFPASWVAAGPVAGVVIQIARAGALISLGYAVRSSASGLGTHAARSEAATVGRSS
jgi:hypothetical protein